MTGNASSRASRTSKPSTSIVQSSNTSVTRPHGMLNPLAACCGPPTPQMSDLVADTENEIVLESAQGQRILVRYTSAAFEVLEGHNTTPILSTSPRNVLRISVSRQSDTPSDRIPVTIAALSLCSGNLELWKRDFWIVAESYESAVVWAERVTSLCYDGMCLSFCD